jgi:phosphoglycerate dehydrogenase-like enzyme
MTRIIAALPAMVRPLVEPHLPKYVDARWFTTHDEALATVADAEIGWLDQFPSENMLKTAKAATHLKWLFTLFAGLDWLPVEQFIVSKTTVTNGVGVSTVPCAEYVMMGILAAAKGFPDVVRAGDRREWLAWSPGTIELLDSKALIIGFGAIGQAIARRLEAFDVEVTAVRRTAGTGCLLPNEWRPRLPEFDWVILAAPATGETKNMFSAGEFAAMKKSAWLINIARGTLVDQLALEKALADKEIAGAFLDVTNPEPLPPDNPLWLQPNAIISMHLSGKAQTRSMERAARLFLENIDLYRAGKPLINAVDLELGY